MEMETFRTKTMMRLARVLGVVILALVVALSVSPAVGLAEVPAPVIAKGKGDKCVEDTGVMRRTHMDLLKHQRDATMRFGIRTTQHSLKECISCHAVPGKDGKPVTVADPQHFCASCHQFVGVRPDCFSCHSSVPEEKGQATASTQGRGQ